MMMECVTLLLGENHVKVSQEDLISKSEYFAALFSPNFKDSQSSEHRINYDIHINTLQTFVDWVSDCVSFVVGDHRCVKPSLAKYVGESVDFEELLQLLQLGVLFGADVLVKDLTNLVACRRLGPEESLRVWLLAKELGLATIRDLAKATCIDRIHDVPEPSLLELSEKDFVELAWNIRVDYTEADTTRYKLLEQWLERNVPPGESDAFMSRYPFTLLQSEKLDSSSEEMHEDECWKRNIQCIVGKRQTPGTEVTKCVYGWDGTTFSEIIELRSSPVWASNIVGVQLVGRGFDIYLVGGEYGRGSEDFQTEIWRYSMITKTWYYVTRMPEPRRHMAVAFLETKLLLAGGRGKKHTHLCSMDVYDINTGEWTKAPEVRESFTNESLMCPKYGSLTFYNQGSWQTHTYDPRSNCWDDDDWCYCHKFSFRICNPSADPDLVAYYNYFGASMRNYFEDQWDLFNFGDESEEESEVDDEDEEDGVDDEYEEESEVDDEDEEDGDENENEDNDIDENNHAKEENQTHSKDNDMDEKKDDNKNVVDTENQDNNEAANEDDNECENEDDDRNDKVRNEKANKKDSEIDNDGDDKDNNEEVEDEDDDDEVEDEDEDEFDGEDEDSSDDDMSYFNLDKEYIRAEFMMTHNDRHYVLGPYKDISSRIKLFEFEDVEDGRSYFLGNCSRHSFDNQVANGPSIVGFKFTEDGTMCVTVIGIDGKQIRDSTVVYEEKRTDIQDLCMEDPIGCFNVYNADSLNELFVVPEK